MTLGIKQSVYFVLAILSGYMLLNSTPVSAAGWDPGNIIDDVVFTNTTSMDVNSIQNFLNSKVPVCDTNHARTSSGNDSGPPYTCLKDYRENGKSSAQIIYDVAHKYQINPQVLIVLLQKEQALVTDTWPWAIQYKTATGYGCPDTAPCDSQYYGLTNQLDWAAKMFRSILNASPDWYTPYVMGNNFIQYNPQGSCGGTNVFIKNRTTQALYNYTPYQPNPEALAAGYGSAPPCGAYGNRNFWLYFNDWFGSTQAAGKWLRKDPSGQVWLIAEGELPNGTYTKKKFKLTSWDTIVAYSLQYEPVVPVSYEYLTQYLDDGTLSTRAISKNYSQIQFVNNGKRYFIDSAQTCDAYGFDCFNTNVTKTIPGTELLERVPGAAKAVPPVMSYKGVVYKLQSGQKLPILNPETFQDLGYSWDNLLYDAQDINANQPLGSPQISRQGVFQFTSNSPVVVYNPDGYTFHNVPNYETYVAWGMQNYANLNPAASSFSSNPPASTNPQVSIWATDGKGGKFLIDQGRKIDVTAHGDSFPSTVWHGTSKYLLQKIPTAAFSRYVWVKETGNVYYIDNGQKRSVPSWDDFVGLGLSISQLLPISSFTASQIPTGALKLADGSSFEDPASGVWMVSNQNKYHLPAWEYFSHFSLDPSKMHSGQSNLTASYAGTQELTTLVKSFTGEKFIVYRGKKISVSESAKNEWGLQDSSFVTISETLLAKMPLSGTLGKFAYHQNLGLFYGSAGTSKHLDSYQSYQNLGGNSSNTPELNIDLFNASPRGSSIP